MATRPDQKAFDEAQTRLLDTMTVQTYCTGCPFKAVDLTARKVNYNGSNPMASIQYKCTSPAWNMKSKLIFMNSSVIGGGGYCPFFLDRWKLKDGNTDPDNQATYD